MGAPHLAETQIDVHPIDVIEAIAGENEWSYERNSGDELSATIAGGWCDFHLTAQWRDAWQAVTVACAFTFRAPVSRRAETAQLIALINERLWLGHFCLASEDGTLMFRHTLPLNGRAGATLDQAETLLRAALDACERYYPAFQFALWGRKSAAEAIEAALLECRGRA